MTSYYPIEKSLERILEDSLGFITILYNRYKDSHTEESVVAALGATRGNIKEASQILYDTTAAGMGFPPEKEMQELKLRIEAFKKKLESQDVEIAELQEGIGGERDKTDVLQAQMRVHEGKIKKQEKRIDEQEMNMDWKGHKIREQDKKIAVLSSEKQKDRILKEKVRKMEKTVTEQEEEEEAESQQRKQQ